MASSNFVDYVKIFCRSGKGGAGSKHLYRDKLTQKGGPDGGDGGRGGHVILRGSKDHWTLIHLKYARHIHAGDGEGGSQSRSFGKEGEDNPQFRAWLPKQPRVKLTFLHWGNQPDLHRLILSIAELQFFQ